MALPWELQVQTPKPSCLQHSRVVHLAPGRHTELPAVQPGAVHAHNNFNKSQRQACPVCVRAQRMHLCCLATTTAAVTSAATAMPAGCRAERGTRSKYCSLPLSPDPPDSSHQHLHFQRAGCAPLPAFLPPLCNGAFAASWAAGKHLSATLTPSTIDLKSITPEHRARLLLTETIKL